MPARLVRKIDGREAMKAFASFGAVLGVVAMSLAPFPAAAAGKYDGSAPLVCAATAVTECGADGACHRRSAESVNLPELFRVDVKAMKVRNLEAAAGRESLIRTADHANGKMILYGAEAERGWIVLIHEDTGKMSAVVSGDGEGFVIFGQCALP
jgi:hypothetical protein